MNGQACLDILRLHTHDIAFRRNGVPSRIAGFLFHRSIGQFWLRYDSQQSLRWKTSYLERLAQLSVDRLSELLRRAGAVQELLKL